MSNREHLILNEAMRRACQEARLWLGATSPNPPVGAAALDQHGRILAVAAHHRAGSDHAEAALLKLCREQKLIEQIHTLCVTLEPCNHHGRTPPCSEAIIAAGIRHMAIGTSDPNSMVKGGGAERLRAAGVEVTENVEGDLCRRLIHAFTYQAQTGKPFVTVKRAFDGGGSMIPPVGQKTFTSPESLILAHRLRKKADAVIVGSGTILADNPLFDVRHVPDFSDKRRILAILDRRGRVPSAYIEQATRREFDVVIYHDFDQCLNDLSSRGAQDVLVESGPILSRFVLDSPCWCMKVDIHAGTPDRIITTFNPTLGLPFNTDNLQIEALLPL
jgi:diaminohydroxyphosphoribosylaminopyrimidine deaminase/5-amino-6-(5-phosphoribosylamino)uracil reductase